MFEDELQQLLREIAGHIGAEATAIVRPHDGDEPGVGAQPPAPDAAAEAPEPAAAEAPGATAADPVRARMCGDNTCLAPLGGGAFLHAEFADGSDRTPEGRLAAMERAARTLRTCARRWGESHIPALEPPRGTPPSIERARDRARRYLQALCNTENAANALVSYRGEIIASARELGELHRDRVPFIVKRIEAEAARLRGQTSHAEVAGDDFFSVGFWFDACLLVFFSGPFALDFIRHRARLVTRELASIMPMLDDDPPPDPVNIAE